MDRDERSPVFPRGSQLVEADWYRRTAFRSPSCLPLLHVQLGPALTRRMLLRSGAGALLTGTAAGRLITDSGAGPTPGPRPRQGGVGVRGAPGTWTAQPASSGLAARSHVGRRYRHDAGHPARRGVDAREPLLRQHARHARPRAWPAATGRRVHRSRATVGLRPAIRIPTDVPCAPSACRRRVSWPTSPARSGSSPTSSTPVAAWTGSWCPTAGRAMGYWTERDLPFTYDPGSPVPNR